MVRPPYFSIIIPAYNCSDTIGKAIGSVSNQDFADLEIIVVNDGSTDRTMNILEAAAFEDSRIRVYNQENRGVSAARNSGVSKAQGAYLLFLDSDDQLAPRALNIFAAAIINFGMPDIVFARYKINGVEGEPSKHMFLDNSKKCTSLAGSYVVAKNHFISCGRFNESLAHSENWELMMRLLEFGTNKKTSIGYTEGVSVLINGYKNLEKFLAYKKKKIVSYSLLFGQHRDNHIYPRRIVSYFGMMVAMNYAGLGYLTNTIDWICKSISHYPFNSQAYYKPLGILLKRRILAYKQGSLNG